MALKDLDLRLHSAFHTRRWPLSPKRCVVWVHTRQEATVCFIPVMEGPASAPLPQPTAFLTLHTSASTKVSVFVPLAVKGKTSASMGKKVPPDHSLQVEAVGFFRDSTVPGPHETNHDTSFSSSNISANNKIPTQTFGPTKP